MENNDDNHHLEEFDVERGKSWIYPTNYPTREYQYNIIQKALFNNTLVSLPTGLGKTFIAAVVMYNFYNWYPRGKIIFMAPTKPLVQQQIDACYNIMAIPMESTIVLTGTKASLSRANLWQEHRVFYVTPQVLQNDLNKLTELGATIKCIVFDEAHKAHGNYAYCNVVKKLIAQGHRNFRVLALTATPGSNVNNVAEVIRNLLISHLEFRTEESIDVQPHVFRRSLETIVVPLDKKLQEIKDEYLQILEHYTKTLRKFDIIQGNCSNISKGKIFMIMKNFQSQQRDTKSPQYSQIMSCLNISVTLYHAFDLLIRHGLRNFLYFFNEHKDKPLLRYDINLQRILDKIRQYLGPFSETPLSPKGCNSNVSRDAVFGHPKFYKLKEILCSHFEKSQQSTKVIVFFEYRESVMEAHTLLLQCKPLIKPKVFVGKGAGVSQKTQTEVVRAFREGQCNTLLSTCIGEEGLDVGEVDLIVCFDISNKSPVRMIQRMGRTGRKRDGRVLILVTQGREEQTLKDCLYKSNKLPTFVFQSKQLLTELYSMNPRMVPDNINPKCEKKFIVVKPLVDNKKSSSRNSIIKNAYQIYNDVEVLHIEERIPKMNSFFNKSECFNINKQDKKRNLFRKHIEKQRSSQKTFAIGHSEHSKSLTNLLNFADFMRFNIQHFNDEFHKTKNLKQSNLKEMFLNIEGSASQDFEDNEISISGRMRELKKKFQKMDSDGLLSQNPLLKKDFTILSDYLLEIRLNSQKTCKHCSPEFKCDNFKIPSNNLSKNLNISIMCESVLETIERSHLKSFAQASPFIDDTLEIEMLDDDYESILEQVDFMQLELEANKNENNEVDNLVSNSIKNEDNVASDLLIDQAENDLKQKSFENLECSSENILEVIPQEQHKVTEISEKQLLDFFKLSSIHDIFNDFEECERSPILVTNKTIKQTDSIPLEIADNVLTNENNDVNFDEFCDLSYYGHTITENLESKIINNTKKNDSCVNLEMSPNTSCNESNLKEIQGNCVQQKDDKNHVTINIEDVMFNLNEFCDFDYFGLSETRRKSTNFNEKIRGVYFEKSPVNRRNNSTLLHNITNASTTDKEINFDGVCSSKFSKSLSRSRSDSDFESMSIPSKRSLRSPSIPNRRRKKKKVRKLAENFLDLEAEVSANDNEEFSNDEDEDTFDNDFDQSFVDNATQVNDTEMHAVYLKSIKSPSNRKNIMRKPLNPIKNLSDIYSQPIPEETNAYLEDSFCVDREDNELTQQHELSQLEILEKKLNQKRKRKVLEISPKKNRRRIYCISSDSE